MHHKATASHAEKKKDARTEHDVARADKDDIKIAYTRRLGYPIAETGQYDDTEEHRRRGGARSQRRRTCA